MKKTIVLLVVAIVVIAALAGIAVYLASQAPPTPAGPALASVTLTTTPKSILNQTETVVITARAVDTEGSDQTSNVTWSWSASPSNAVIITQTAVDFRVTIRGVAVGAATVAGQATLGESQKSGSAALTVEAIEFDVRAQGTVAAVGEPFDITVTVVKSSSGATVTGYDGTVHFTSTDPAAVLPPDGPVLQGVRVFQVRYGTSGPQTITVTDTNAPTVTGAVQVQGDRRPVADFTINPNSTDRRVVTFTSISTDPDGDAITSFDWEFGDGETGTGATVTHTYAVTQQVTVSLTVTDEHGLPSPPATKTYIPGAPPEAFFVVNGTQFVAPDIRIYVNATESQGMISTYNWTWGDGMQTEEADPLAFHDYGPAYTDQDVDITLNVTDVDGLWDTFTSTVTVTIAPLPPVAVLEVTDFDNITLEVLVDASMSRDPNGNIATLRWDWDDGNSTSVSFSPDNLTAYWQYELEGDYDIVLTVTDTTGLFDTDTQSVSLFHPPSDPVAAFTVSRNRFHVDVNASLSFDLNDDITTYEWDFENDGLIDATGETSGHDYPSTDLFTIRLVVTDSRGAQDSTTRKVSVASSTIDYTFWDFFNVPFKDYWDFRGDKYGDLPIGATCFNETAATYPDSDFKRCAGEALGPIPDNQETWYTSPPYTNWYPSPGSIRPGHPSNNPFIFTPYRIKVVAANVDGYSAGTPVFFPVFDPAVTLDPTSYVNFEWEFGYTTIRDKLYLQPVCGIFGFDDGFDDTSNVTLTMDLTTSARLFDVDASGATLSQKVANARSWWNANANDDDCGAQSNLEAQWGQWYIDNGGGQTTTGTYDVANSCEWYYIDFMTQVDATVADDGTTTVRLWNVGYCQEVLLSRWFYWGSTSYIDHWDDSTMAAGWWGMELAWFEDFVFTGTLTTTSMDFSLASVMQYHLEHGALPGSDGNLDKVNDIPTWFWVPFLTDYTNDWNPSKHFISELDRYPTDTYLHSTPGSPLYGLQRGYDYVPVSWSPAAGEEWHFIFPRGDVLFYDPKTAAGANPIKPFTDDPTVKAYIPIFSPLVYTYTRPGDFGDWDSGNMTWDIFGPISPALGPDGSPGAYARDETDPSAAAASIAKPKIVFRNSAGGAAALGAQDVSGADLFYSDVRYDTGWSGFVTKELRASSLRSSSGRKWPS
jgi:PKD repeat protein